MTGFKGDVRSSRELLNEIDKVSIGNDPKELKERDIELLKIELSVALSNEAKEISKNSLYVSIGSVIVAIGSVIVAIIK